MADPANYTNPTVIAAEGARVGIVSCKRCGCALILDNRDTINVFAVHDTVCPGA